MRYEATKSIPVFLMVLACVQGASFGTSDKPVSQFTGTWEGRTNGQPAVEITLTANGGRIAGTIAFYFQMLGKDGKWHVEGQAFRQPLIAPHVDGNAVTFEVLHYQKHGGSELGPNKTYRLEVKGVDEAQFIKSGNEANSQRRPLKLRRRPSQ